MTAREFIYTITAARMMDESRPEFRLEAALWCTHAIDDHGVRYIGPEERIMLGLCQEARDRMAKAWEWRVVH